MKYFIIANPLSKIVKKGKLKYFEDFFRENNYEVTIYFSKFSGHSLELAYEIASKHVNEEITIIAAGGDGTINEVCNGIVKSDSRNVYVGIIPCGTANVIAKEFKIPESDFNKVAKIILNKKCKRVYLSRIDEIFFLFTCGIGFDGAVVENVNLRLKKVFGKYAYIFSSFKILFNLNKLPQFEVFINNGNISVKSVVINRTKQYAGKFSIFKEADIFGENFNVLIFKNLNLRIFMKFLIDIFLKKEIKNKNYLFISSDKILIKGNGKLPVQIDGDFYDEFPQKIYIAKDKFINFIVP